MRFSVIVNDFIANLKSWSRSKGTVFWTLLFPVILILIFGAIFSGVGETSYDLYVQDLDDSVWSNGYIDVLKNISVLNVKIVEPGVDIEGYMSEQEASSALVINEGFGDTLTSFMMGQDVTTDIDYYHDPSDQTTTSVIQNIISSSLYEFNMEISGGEKVIGIEEHNIISEDFEFIDFFVPGMIGFTIMQSCIYGSIERNTKYRKDGILRKLLTMPVTRTEWILSKMLFMLFLSFLSTLIIIIVGMLVYNLTVNFHPLMIVVIVGNSFLFSGLGMIIGRFVKEEETADMAGGAISFPMMFLAGTFFPLEQMPEFLQGVAQVLPLYYVNEGLRYTMINFDITKALFYTGIVLVFAGVFFFAGVFLTKWSED